MLNHIVSSNCIAFVCSNSSSRKMYRRETSQISLFLLIILIGLAHGVQHFETFDDHGGGGGGGGGGGNSECALLLEGPGRSSAFDYNLNTLRGNQNYNGPHTCITYDAVNNAYIQARKYVRVVERRERYEHEELATIGELLLEVSRVLARQYGLSLDEIEHGLPLIDTAKTHIREICPAFLSNVHCQAGKYRRYDGLCNNLKHPTWGAVQAPFARLLKPVYSDSMSDPRIGFQGSTLPPPRIVSRTIHPDEGYHDHAATILIISWGQFMDHDLTLTATPLDPLTRNELEECCNRPPNARNPYCMPIDIPHDDPFYGVYGVRCIDFVRGFPAVRAGCRLGSRNQFNILTGILDGNTVYGVEEGFAKSLRSGYGGLLRMNPVFAQYGLHDLLPLKLDIPEEGCTRPNRSMYCFDAGEIRVNEQLVLTCMHTLMAREHNRVAHRLGEVNPHWDDEILYQEARRITIAEIQHVTYNEFLPLVLGKEVMAKFGLLLQKDGYWDGYDPNVNSGVLASFAAAAFRFGHSLLPTNVERWSKAHKFIASRRLRDLIRQPFDLYRAGVIDEYFMGMANQVAQAMDDSVTQEVTNHLFRKPGQPFGVDLAAFNMARGREFGLPSYMEYRKYCGLPGAEGWDELFGSMNNITVKRYSQIYVHPQDIDLWSGGVSERPLPGAMVGPTFACIIASQFSNSRRGDRFWYELGGHPHSFTPEQLGELRKARLARIVCDNTDIIDTIQLYPMVLPDHEINPRVPCRSGVLLNIDFSKWADYGHGGGQFSQNAPVHVDTPNLNSAYGNDPSIGKYVNQDGIQQLRHYLKVGPYATFKQQNPFIGYIKKIIEKGARTAIDGTQGQDLSNLANVVYSPNPIFEPDPITPEVDLGPRGKPINPPFIPLKQDGGGNYATLSRPLAPPLNDNRFEQFASIQPPALPVVLNNAHPPPPPQGAGAGLLIGPFAQQIPASLIASGTGATVTLRPEFANNPPILPLAAAPGPLNLHYGFKPVSSPYGGPILTGGSEPGFGGEPSLLQTLENVLSSDRNVFKRSPPLKRPKMKKSKKPIVVQGDSVRIKRDTNSALDDEEIESRSTKTSSNQNTPNRNITSILMNPIALRNAILSSAIDVMDGLTDLSKHLITRIRNSTVELFNNNKSSSNSASSSTSGSVPILESVAFVPLEAQNSLEAAITNYNKKNDDELLSLENNDNNNNSQNVKINNVNSSSKPTPLLASFNLNHNQNHPNITKQRIELAKKATSFVTKILKDLSQRASKQMQQILN